MSETISAPQGFFLNDTVTPATITDLLSAVEAAEANLSGAIAAEDAAEASATAAASSATSAGASASSATSSASSASTSASTASGAASTATTEASAASSSATAAASSASSAATSASSASTSATGSSNSASAASTSATSASGSASSAASSLASLLAVNPLSTTSGSAQSVASALTFNGAITLAAALSVSGAFTVTLSPSGAGQVIISPATAGTMDNMTLGGTTAKPAHVTTLGATGLISPNSVAGIVGTTLGDNAQAGSIGELLQSGGNVVSATVTTAVASPGVVGWSAHGMTGIAPVQFSNAGGALPTGLAAGTTYWTIPGSITTNTFEVATSIANAIAGTAVNFTGSSTGTQTCYQWAVTAANTPLSIAAINLTAGDWDVSGVVQTPPGAASLTAEYVSISVSLNALGGMGMLSLWAGAASTAAMIIPTPVVRINVSTTTPVYLVVNQASGGAGGAGGYMRARRVR